MLTTISTSHVGFFRQHQWIELEELLTTETAEHLRSLCSSLSSLSDGRDVFRTHPEMRKIILNKTFAKIASQLTGDSFIRILFDQVFLSKFRNDASYFHTTTLKEISSFQGLSSALLLRLSPGELSEDSIYPKKVGSGTFISSEKEIDIPFLLEPSNQCFLLIVYGTMRAVYKKNLKDPLNHALKQLGYTYGDMLQEDTHPILVRSG